MGLASRHFRESRPLHLFDSFQGLPEPSAEDGEAAAAYSGGKNSGQLTSIQQCAASEATVRDFLFQELKLDSTNVFFHPGWFQDTVPKAAEGIGGIALLRLDGDWYDSTRVCMEQLYPRLRGGGIIVLDDYFCWAGCKKAADNYRRTLGVREEIVRIDEAAGYWVKR
jgi:hypothetical protein